MKHTPLELLCEAILKRSQFENLAFFIDQAGIKYIRDKKAFNQWCYWEKRVLELR